VVDLQNATHKAHGDVALLIQRQDERTYVPVPVE
jgi:hypothetical protein